MLQSRGFDPRLITWVMRLVMRGGGGSICIRVNDVNSPYFKSGKSLRREF
jgi:hypothetical protein